MNPSHRGDRAKKIDIEQKKVIKDLGPQLIFYATDDLKTEKQLRSGLLQI